MPKSPVSKSCRSRYPPCNWPTTRHLAAERTDTNLSTQPAIPFARLCITRARTICEVAHNRAADSIVFEQGRNRNEIDDRECTELQRLNLLFFLPMLDDGEPTVHQHLSDFGRPYLHRFFQCQLIFKSRETIKAPRRNANVFVGTFNSTVACWTQSDGLLCCTFSLQPQRRSSS